jgi:hypothetical protein
MRAYVWNTLRNVVFPDFKRRQKVFREGQRIEVQNVAEESFRAAVAELPGFAGTLDSEQAVRFDDIAERLNVGTGDIAEIVKEYGLGGDAARRFKRVLVALAASELLTDFPGSDLLPLYRAIAAGIY